MLATANANGILYLAYNRREWRRPEHLFLESSEVSARLMNSPLDDDPPCRPSGIHVYFTPLKTRNRYHRL